MQAEIIAIGDELTGGQLLDTNTQWLSQRLEEMGIRVLLHTTVGDDLAAMTDVFRLAAKRADVIVATGGLGPTADDLTREAVAQMTGRELVLDADALAHIEALFARHKRRMPEQNRRQAMIPAGGSPIANPHGTAPGIAVDVARDGRGPCRMFALPGVPAEMKEMWSQTVAPLVRRAGAGARVIAHRKIKCFGAGESTVESMLPDLIRRGHQPRVGINASKTTIILRITAEGASWDQCQSIMEPTVATIYRCLGKFVFGEGDDELQHAVVRLLGETHRTLATCEWGTAGLVADWLGEVGGAQQCYVGGLVVSNQQGLQQVAGMSEDLIAGHGAVSSEAAAAMAAGCRRLFGADYGLAVSRLPPSDDSAPAPKPLFLGLAGPGGVDVKAVPCAGHPATLKIYCAKHALNMVRLALQSRTSAFSG